MTETKHHARRISVKEDFMNYKTDDILYGFLRGISTVKTNPDDSMVEYLPLKTYKEYKEVISRTVGCSVRNLTNKINKLKEIGLVAETTITAIGNKGKIYEYPSYIFPYEPEGGYYRIVEKDLLRFLAETRSADSIRTYVYLLNKFEYKPGYIFTAKEIKMAFGYAETTKTAETAITHILQSLRYEGFIDWERTITMEEHEGKEVPVPRMKLKNVAKSLDEIKSLQEK